MAWFLLLVCFWMGSGGVLHHTEEQASARAGSLRPSGLHQPTAAVPTDSCAACEWTQGLQGRTLAVLRVITPLFSLCPHSQFVPPSPLRRIARCGMGRAPPLFLTNA